MINRILSFIVTLLILCGCQTQTDEWEWPQKYDGKLHEAIKDADCIVVREGGYYYRFDWDTNHPIHNKTFFVITDPKEINELYENIKVQEMNCASCDCAGTPGIDWYKNRRKIAMTSSKHCNAIVWKNEIENHLTKESSQWLKNWFLKHGLTKKQIK